MTSLSTAPDLFFKSPPASSVVVVIGGDTSLRRALDAVAHDAGWRTETVTSISALVDQRRTFTPGCLVLDVSQPESDDLLLRQWPTHIPVICITDAGDVSLSVRAMKAGAVDVLTKPVGRALLLDAVRLALNRSAEGLRQEVELNEMRERYASLSRREREVMTLVASGLMNKQVAGELGISEITVKAHRGRVMRKMKARSLANLVIMADRLQLKPVSGSDYPPGTHRYPNVAEEHQADASVSSSRRSSPPLRLASD
jgi:FixJ family two-component response regulator